MAHAHVVSNPAGGWDVIHQGGQEPVKNFNNRLEAVNAARARLDEFGGGLIVVHGSRAQSGQSGIDAA